MINIKRKPWLNYKGALKEAEEIKRARDNADANKQKSYGWALFWLVALAPIGGHKFYIGKPGIAWIFIGVYFLISLIVEAFYHLYDGKYYNLFLLALLVYWAAIILLSYRPLRHDIVRFNNGER